MENTKNEKLIKSRHDMDRSINVVPKIQGLKDFNKVLNLVYILGVNKK